MSTLDSFIHLCGQTAEVWKRVIFDASTVVTIEWPKLFSYLYLSSKVQSLCLLPDPYLWQLYSLGAATFAKTALTQTAFSLNETSFCVILFIPFCHFVWWHFSVVILNVVAPFCDHRFEPFLRWHFLKVGCKKPLKEDNFCFCNGRHQIGNIILRHSA